MRTSYLISLWTIFFTKDITILSEIVLIASFGYLFISYQQSKYELQKVYSSYDKLKDSYREILTEDDIRECFQNDDIKTEMKRTIDKICANISHNLGWYFAFASDIGRIYE